MINYNEIARKINNHIETAVADMNSVFKNEKEGLEISTAINTLRSTESSPDILSDYVMKSQTLIIAQTLGVTDGLLLIESSVLKEGREKQAQEEARIAAQKRKEQEEKEDGDDSNE